MKKIVSCAMVAGLAVVGMGGVCGEKPYDFRKRLDVVHESGRRDPAAKPAADEFVVKDGFVIALPPDATDLMRFAARDFEEYLDVSMGVSARIERIKGMALGAENVLSAGRSTD